MSSSDSGSQTISPGNWQQVRTDGDFRPEWLEQHQYAVLNPLNVPAAEWGQLPCKALQTPNANVRPEMLPHLVFLNELDEESRSGLLELVQRNHRRGVAFFCMLLKSSADAETVTQHLCRYLEQRRPGSRQRWWLRFYKPEVLRHLIWILTSEQIEKLVGPMDEWRWPDGWGRWHSYTRRTVECPMLDALLMTRGQWQSIDRLSLLNGCLGRLENLTPEWARNARNWPTLDNWILDAQSRHGMSRDEDRQLYAEQAARFHPRIHQHMELKKRLTAQHEQGKSYVSLCRDLTPEMMLTFAKELEEMS